jgi:hypothetical protein
VGGGAAASERGAGLPPAHEACTGTGHVHLSLMLSTPCASVCRRVGPPRMRRNATKRRRNARRRSRLRRLPRQPGVQMLRVLAHRVHPTMATVIPVYLQMQMHQLTLDSVSTSHRRARRARRGHPVTHTVRAHVSLRHCDATPTANEMPPCRQQCNIYRCNMYDCRGNVREDSMPCMSYDL